jgi:hypothetical protein
MNYAEVLELLYAGSSEGYTTISVRYPDGHFSNYSFPLADRAAIVQFIQNHLNYDLYIKRASQRRKPERGSSGRTDLAHYQRVITADIDIQSDAHKAATLPRSKDEALKLLDESDLPEPTLIVHTGNGLMPVWVLRESAPVAEVMPVQTGVENALRLAAARFGWTLDKTSDAARSIRIIGSYNWKQRPVKKPVVVIQRSDQYYSLEDLTKFARRPLVAPRRSGSAATRETIETLLKYIPGDGLEYNRWLAAVWAIQSALSEDEAAEVLDNWTYDWRKHQKPEEAESGIGVLINLAREYGFDGDIPGLRGGFVTLPELPNATKINQRFIDIDLPTAETGPHPRIVVIRSAKGTGKTEWLRRVVARYDRVLSVGHRVSLVLQTAKRLGLQPYYDSDKKKWITTAPRIATTIHSLDKLESDAAYDVVIIDEVEQVLKAIVNDANLKHRKVRAVGALLEHMLRARSVLLTDADIGEATLTVLNNYFAHCNVSYIENEYKLRLIDYAVLHPTAEDVLAVAKEFYNYKTKIAIACNTRADADKAEEYFKAFVPEHKILKITAESNEDNNETLENINERLADIDVFIYSPSVGTGVSIDIEGFALFGIARNGPGVGDVDDFRQQLGRFRNPLDREVHLFVEKKQMNEPVSPETYRDLALLRKLESDFRVSRVSGVSEPATTWDQLYLDLFSVVKAKTAAQKNHFFDNFVGALLAEGVELYDERDTPILPPPERAALAKTLKELRAIRERERAERIANAPEPDAAQTDEEQRNAERKAELAERYGIEVDAQLVLDDEKGAYKEAQCFASVEDSALAQHLDEIERTRRFSADRNYFSLFAFWVTTLLTALRLKLEEGAVITITDEFLDLVERNALVLQAALGVKVRADFRQKPMLFVGALLRKLGVGLKGEQRRQGGERIRIYRLVNVTRARARTTGIRRRFEAHRNAQVLTLYFAGSRDAPASGVTTPRISKRKAVAVTAVV